MLHGLDSTNFQLRAINAPFTTESNVMASPRHPSLIVLILSCALTAFGCSSSDSGSGVAHVQIKNNFNDPQITSFQPPWTICKSSYLGVQFGQIDLGQTSTAHDVSAGLDYVIMVAAWSDPSCSSAKSLPIASKNKEEVVSGQTRTITIAMSNHQGPCPPEGVAPIPEDQYDRILQLWPEYNFKPYADRAQNTQCAASGSSSSSTTDGGTEGGSDSGTESGNGDNDR